MANHATTLPGVDRHGGRFRVRVLFPQPHGRVIETGIATVDEANARALALRARRAAGLPPDQPGGANATLGAAASALLAAKRSRVSRKTRRRLRAGGIEWWARILRPWIEGEHADSPLDLLNPARVAATIAAREKVAPKTARDELYGLKATLRAAAARGATFEPALLDLEPVIVERRRRRVLTVDELELLASCAPVYARRMLLFKGTVGCRIGELFTLTDEQVHLDAACIYIPAELCKEATDKWVELTGEEVQLLREQLLARAPGTRYVFPTKTGLTWQGRYGDWHRMVWAKALRRAAAAWQAEHELAEDAPTPFSGLQPHDLRATAATLMRDAGFGREDAAARLGHADSGQLLDRLYDEGDRRARMRRAIAERAPEGLRALAAPAPVRPNHRPTAGAASAHGNGSAGPKVVQLGMME